MLIICTLHLMHIYAKQISHYLLVAHYKEVTIIFSSAKTLQISYIGMQTQEVAIKPNLKVILKADAKNLDEVVVVAYGTASKKSITGAVSALDTKDIEMRPVTNAAAALEGAAPGVQINNTYGEPGSDKMSIRIRGFSSVNGVNSPLIVVDGTPYSGNLNDISSDDIESISILKDAASSALYGNKAANGVVLINTKRGKSERLNFRINVKQGMYMRGLPEYDRLGIKDWMETMWKGEAEYAAVDMADKLGTLTPGEYATKNLMGIVKSNIFDAANDKLFDKDGNFIANVLPGYDDLNWNKAMERTGYRQDYNISTDIATEKYDFFASMGYLKEQGYTINSDFDRFSARLNANVRPTKWFKAGVSLNGAISKNNYSEGASEGGALYANPFYQTMMMAPVFPIYKHNTDGSIVIGPDGDKAYNLHIGGANDYLNDRHIIYEMKNDFDRKNRNTLSGQAYGTIMFLKDFEATAKGDIYTYNQNRVRFNNTNVGDGAANNGRLFSYDTRLREYRFSQEIMWNHDFKLHHIDVLLAHESYKLTNTYNQYSKTNMMLEGNTQGANFAETTGATGSEDNYTTESYLGRARYNYSSKYYVDFSFRRDASSRFKDPWGNFWSIGGSWIVSDEKFMKPLRWINNLKLRASYGEVGNDQSAAYYAYQALYLADTNAHQGAYIKSQLANPLLKWEKSSSVDVALEGRLFDRFNFSIDYFDKRSKDLLFDVYNPLSAGPTDLWGTSTVDPTGRSVITKNIGTVSNRGVDIALDADIIRTNDWKWNLGINLTYLKNEIVKLPDHKDITKGVQKLSEGKSIYEFNTYTYAGVDQMDGMALYVADPEKVTEKNIAAGNIIEINGKHYCYNPGAYGIREWHGSALPKAYGSLNTSLSYRGISLTLLGTFSLGGKVYDTNYAGLMGMSANSASALHVDMLKSWNGKPEGMTETSPNRIDPNGTPRAAMSTDSQYFGSASSRWLQNASYFVMKNINIGYDFPISITDKLNISGLRIYGAIENAFTITARKGMNPQYSYSGSSDQTYVTARVVSFGLNLKF